MVEVGDLSQHPAASSGGGFSGFVKFAPGVGEAACVGDGLLLRGGVVVAHEGGVGAVAVALEDAAPVSRDEAREAVSGAAGVPGKDGVALGFGADPEVALLGRAVAGREVFYASFVHLHVAVFEHVGVDRFVDEAERVGGERHPLSERLAGDVNIVPCGEDFLLPVERKVVGVFADDDCCKQPGRCDAAVFQGVESRDDGRCKRVIFAHVFLPNDVPFEKLCGLVIEQLGAFFADAAPLAGAAFYRLGDDSFFDDAQIIRRPRLALFLGARWRCWLGALWLRCFHRLLGFWVLPRE